jgi:hyperosmotically inducible protein
LKQFRFKVGEKMKTVKSSERGSGNNAIITLVLVLVLAGACYYAYISSPALRNALHSVRQSSQDEATASKVRTALLLSKNVSAFDIKVEATQGEVTLTGQVPSEESKTVAGAIAQDTSGVKQVQNEITINPSAMRDSEMEKLGGRVADLEMKTIISDALSKNPELKDQTIEAQVNNRAATLSGTVATTDQKYTAEQVTWQVSGVQGVINNLTVTNAETNPESADDKLARRVEFELYSTKAISLKTMQIHSDGGIVTLSGSVSSRAEKLLAGKIAEGAEGVHKVVNNLTAPDEAEM